MTPKTYWYLDPCVWCGGRVRRMTREHIVPLASGGAFGSENQAMACAMCNRACGVTPLLVWLACLRRACGNVFRARKLANEMAAV